MAPRWTYSEANATRWRHLFDDLLGGTPSVEVPLEGNGKSLCSLRIRISDALKWLADRSEPYAQLKRALSYEAHGDSIFLSFRPPQRYRAHHLDPSLHNRLVSALQRPELKPTTRAKIEALLDPRKHHLPTAIDGSPEQ